MHLGTKALLGLTLLCSTPASQCEVQKLQPPGPPDGVGVWAVQGDEALVRLQGGMWLCSWTPFGWTQTEELKPSDAPAFEGGAGALDGNTLAIGSASYLGSSAVYVFERSSPGAPWVEVAKFVPSPTSAPETFLTFGLTVALEGGVLAVGAPGSIMGFTGPGVVNIYERESGSWTEKASIVGYGVYPGGAGLGGSVDIEAGDVIATAPYSATFQPSSVRIYGKVGATWEFVQILKEEGSHDLASDHGWLALTDDSGFDTGVFLFQKTGGTWSKTAALPPPSPAWRPQAVSVSGPLMVVGDRDYDGFGSEAGAAFLFEEVAGAWTAVSALAPADIHAFDHFGVSVAIDGDHILAGAQPSGSPAQAYAFSASSHGCPTLKADLYVVSSSVGGAQSLALDAGPGHAGQLYLVAGTLSGFWPGTTFAGQTIPLNADLYLVYTLFHGGSPPLVGNLGFLDGAGQATAQVVLPPDPLLAGLQANHAFGVADAAFNLVHVSNPVPLLVQ